MQQARGVNDAANSSSGHAPRMPAVDVSLAFEVSGFVVELVAKRPRIETERLDSSWRHRNGSLSQKLTTFGEKPGSHLAVELGFFLVRRRVVSQGKQIKALPAAHLSLIHI